jgi:hypothetical protein
MSKDNNPSVNEVIKKHPSNYLSITKLIATARPDPTNLDWVKIQQAATNGDIQQVDDLLFSCDTNDAAKNLAKTEMFSFSLQPSGEEDISSPNSILYLLGAEGYIKILNCIIDSQIAQITNIQKQIDDIPMLQRIMTLPAQVELAQNQNMLEAQLNDWQHCLEVNIDNLLTIAVNRSKNKVIELICDKFRDKLNLDKFSSHFPLENTLLATSSKLNHFPIVQALLRYNADPNAGDKQTEMPLINAITNGNIKMVQFLIKNGANLDVVAIHRGSKVDENGGVKFFANAINVEDAIKLAPNSEEMESCINEIKSKGEFFKQEMSKNGPNSTILSWLPPSPIEEIIEEEILGQHPEQVIEE